MADLTKQQLIIESNNTYLNNNSGEIGADNVRAFNETLIDNTVNQADYTADSSSFDARIEAGGGGTVPAGTVSGSSQIDYPQISNIPSGIVSGSIQVTLEDTTFTDGTQYQVLRTDGAGNLSFDYADRAQIEVRASEAIAKGDPLYVVGFNVGQNRVEVGKADASDPSKMPAYGIAYEAVSINTNTQMVALGTLQDIDTQVTYDFQVGETVYVAVGGGLTNVKPTGTNLIQNVGIVGRRNQNNGEILVSAIGRSNDVPNIQQGYAWVGNASGVATAVATSSFAGDVPVGTATTGSNTFDGDQTISGSVTIQDTNAPMSGLVIQNNSGTGVVQIIPAGDYITTFNDSSLTGITTYGGYKVSGSWGAVGSSPGGFGSGGVVGIYNNNTSSAIAAAVIRHNTAIGGEPGYTAYESVPNISFPGTGESQLRLKGTNITLSASTASKQTSVTVDGDVTGSTFTGSFVGDGSQLTFGGTNLVSGSSQITDGSGLLSSSVTDFNTYSSSVDSRIDAITTIDTGSFATTGSNTFTGDQYFGTYNLNTVGTLGTINANVSNVFAVTQSQESTIGTIVLSYPFTGSQGNNGLVAQKFSTYEGGTQFDQQISGVDFSYFKATNGGIIFETNGFGEIKFFSANDTEFGPGGNFKITNDSNITQDSSGPIISLFQNPQFLSEYYGNQLYWDENNGNSGLNVAATNKTEILLNTWSGSYDNALFLNCLPEGAEFSDWDGSYTRTPWLTVAKQGTPTFTRGLQVDGQLQSTMDAVDNNNQVNTVKVNNWIDPQGYTIANSTLGWQRYDGTVQGFVQELYTGDYSYGSSVQHEPGKWEAILFASGSAYSGGSIKVQDQGDTSVQITLDADKTNVTNVMKLSQLDPLPAGTIGELAVSGSNLYFYDGSWRQVSLV
jgi:hypothetical protein